jgi:hypothetical protein
MNCGEDESGVGGWPACHESIEHVDGTTECLGDGPCGLPHALHDWVLRCAEADPACRCAHEAVPAGDRWRERVAAAAGRPAVAAGSAWAA